MSIRGASRGVRWAADAALVAVVVFTGTAGAGASGSASAGPTSGTLEVTVRSARLTLNARDVPLREVLTAIGRHSDVRIVLSGDFSIPVTQAFVNVPIDEAIRRLSRWYSMVLIYDGPRTSVGGAALTEVWVTGTSAAQSTTSYRSYGSVEEPSTQGPRTTVREPGTAPSRPAQLTRVLRSGPSNTRTGIVEALARELGTPAVVELQHVVALEIEADQRALASCVHPVAPRARAAVDPEEEPGVVPVVGGDVDDEVDFEREIRAVGIAGRRADRRFDGLREPDVVRGAVQLIRTAYRCTWAHEGPLHADAIDHGRVDTLVAGERRACAKEHPSNDQTRENGNGPELPLRLTPTHLRFLHALQRVVDRP